MRPKDEDAGGGGRAEVGGERRNRAEEGEEEEEEGRTGSRTDNSELSGTQLSSAPGRREHKEDHER